MGRRTESLSEHGRQYGKDHNRAGKYFSLQSFKEGQALYLVLDWFNKRPVQSVLLVGW